MNTELKDKLLISDDMSDELECFLSTFFTHSKHIEGQTIEYGELLRVRYSNNGQKIQSIVWPEGGCPDLLSKFLKEAEKTLHKPSQKKVAAKVIYFAQPVTSCLRVGDEFQIIPVPPENPQAPYLAADHPAILEYAYNASDDFSLDHLRQDKCLYELSHFLGIIHHHIMKFDKPSSNSFWANIETEYDVRPTWTSEGYAVKGAWPEKDEFGFSVSSDWEPMALEEPDKYYKKYAATVGQDTRFPSFTETLYFKFQQLPLDQKSAFLRSIHWFQMSDFCRQQSLSLAYSVLVFAIESLISPATKKKKCGECGTEIFESLGSKFKAFLSQNNSSLTNQQISRLLKMRSKFVHGNALMASDSEASLFNFKPITNEQNDEYRQLKLTTRIVLINWFISHPDQPL